jgi:hypothetical protein
LRAERKAPSAAAAYGTSCTPMAGGAALATAREHAQSGQHRIEQ